MPAPDKIHVLEIEELDLRSVFPREDTAFTPWLATPENLGRLSKALGLELELVDVEVSTGRFRTDIVARYVADGSTVIIGNQFGRSDHDHLGKALTYLSAHEAKTVVWIAESFADEHRATLSWLNDNTPEDVGFYGVVPRLVRVGGSPPGLRFELDVRPNRLVKQIKQSTRPLPEHIGVVRERFWVVFGDRVAQDSMLADVPTRYGGRLGFLWMIPEVPDAEGEPHVLVYVSVSSPTEGRLGLYLAAKGDEAEGRLSRIWDGVLAELQRMLPDAVPGDRGLEVGIDFTSEETILSAIDRTLPALRVLVRRISTNRG